MARGSRQAVAVECLKDPVTRHHLLKKLGVLVRNELVTMCSHRTNSILQRQNSSELREFKWEKLIAELEANAPIFLSILHQCTHTRQPRPNQRAVVAVMDVKLMLFS